MATYRLCVVCALLCIACAVISAKISAKILGFGSYERELELSENVNGDKLHIPESFVLERLVEGNSLTRLTVKNIKAFSLFINNLSLENVPVFNNVSVQTIRIFGNKIKYVPTNAFEGTRTTGLALINNEVQNMAVKSIDTDIENLFLRCNKLTEFSQDWLKNSSLITYLDLSYNRIENIRPHAFNQMTQLDVLLLNNNHIKRIDSEAFGSRIIELHLQFNNIELLTSDMFEARGNSMSELYLHHNQLSFLSEALLLKLKPYGISLDGNPWQCQCMRDMERWIREQNIRRHYIRDRRGEPVCVVPLSFQNVCVQTVDKEIQQIYARGLSPVPEYLVTGCNQHSRISNSYLGLYTTSG